MKKVTSIGVGFNPALLERVDALAQRQGFSRASVIRQLIEMALPLAERGQGIDIPRLILTAEFLNLGLQELLEKISPGQIEELVNEAMQRAREHHGA